MFLLAFTFLFSACGDHAPQDEEAPALFASQNGYEISYPASLSPVSLSSDIDFVIMDENTGSSVTVLTEDVTSSKDITEKSFREEKLSDGMDIEILSFEQKTVNELPAYEVTYKYNENTVTEIIYMASKRIFRATYTELPGTSDKIHNDMTAIISSLCEA